METQRRPAHSPEGDGESLWMLDSLITFKLTGEDTGGGMALMDSVVSPHSGPPPHIHEREDETFYILEGEFAFLAGEETIWASAGSVVYGPRGIVHTYRNIGDEAGRFLTMITPSGFEEFFREVGEPVEDPSAPPEVTPEKIEKMLATAPKYGLEFPPFPGG